ncbi:hypothetical protein SLA2020_468750 [Shorea laevis]
MLGLHNIFLIAPPPLHHTQPPTSNPEYNTLTESNFWTLKRNAQEAAGSSKRDAFLSVEGDHGSFKVCIDCGNRAKKECGFSRCRTCCKSRGYDCATHVKSTWVPAARRRERRGAVVGDSVDDGGSSGSSSCGAKRARLDMPTRSNVEGRFHHQEPSFKESLSGQVRAPAVFRCIRVTAITDGEAEVAYQATVNISGHVFKGFLYDHGIDEKNIFPCISKTQLESSSGRDKFSSSPVVHPPETIGDPEN